MIDPARLRERARHCAAVGTIELGESLRLGCQATQDVTGAKVIADFSHRSCFVVVLGVPGKQC